MAGGGKNRSGGGRKKKGAGSKNVGSRAGGSSRASDSGRDGGDNTDQIGVADGVVEVIFVDDPMRFTCFCSPSEVITQAWLDKVLQDAFPMWFNHLPGVQPRDFIVRAVPQLPRVGSKTFLEWCGFVLIELKEGKEQLGLIEQVRGSRRKEQIAMEEKQRLEGLMASLMEKIDSRVAKATAELRMELVRLKMVDEKHASNFAEMAVKAAKADDEILKLQAEVANLRGEYTDLRDQLDKEVRLNNKVRRRVPLSMARERIIKDLGKEVLYER